MGRQVGRILAALQGELAEAGRIDWEPWCIDGSHVRGHRVAAGAEENRQNSDDEIPAGIVQVICLRGRGDGQTQSDDQNCTPDIFLGRVSPQCELGLLAAAPRP
jgi:hypothetical protein